LTIEVPHTKDRIIIELNKNRLSLESYGTGIHELIILCSALTIYDDYVFCIEEPELHLHPELQRKFLDYILTLNNYFFISIHSNVFIDYKPNVNVYHVVHNKNSTNIYPALSNQDSYEILNDLGYKASDILQSNGIIWVEGPSDRVFINKWISIVQQDFIEGIHYSIMFYGGRLLSHLTLEDDNNELIRLLRINRNAIVVIDRDGINSKTKINATKKRIQEETSEGNCWITKGREIENYLSEDNVIKFLSDYDADVKFVFNKDKKLSENIKSKNKRLKLDYDSNKARYSKEIVEHMSEQDLNVLDLRTKIKHLISQIEKWNNL
jgi:putative ATP-dependent endonuclease of OLD family